MPVLSVCFCEMNNRTVNNIGRINNTPWHSWKSRTRCQKNVIIVVLILLIFIVFVSILFGTLYDPSMYQVCSTPACVQASTQLSKYIDRKANPCQDFYRFACGNFLVNTNLDNRGSQSVQDVMEDEIQSDIRRMLEDPIRPEDPTPFNAAKKFYKACMNEKTIDRMGLSRIKQIFKRMGGWPTYEGDDWNEEEFDWKKAVYELRDMGVDFDFFFEVAPERDPRNGSRYILGIRDAFHNSPSNISNEIKGKYVEYMIDVALFFGAKSSTVRRDSEEVLDLLLNMVKISKISAALNSPTVYKIYHLHEKYRSINWLQYLYKLIKSEAFILFDDDVLVTGALYLEKLEKLLKDTSNRTLANFMAWHTMQNLIDYLPSKLSHRAYRFLGEVNGQMMRPQRWKTCIKATKGRMETVISTAYIRNFFNDTTKEGALEIIRNVKTQFRYNLKKQNWLDRNTRNVILETLTLSTEEIVSYDDIKDALEEASLYEGVQVYENNLLDSALNLDYINLNIKFRRLRKRFNDNWLKNSSFVTGVNIYYSPKENILRFPVGIFRGLYYQPDRPKYINYGILGSIIAHEISHIFIQAEHRDVPSDPPAELRGWWSPESLLNYDAKVQCLANQYRKFEVAELGKHLNPSKTRDEDVADLAGMKVSYDTYAEWVRENNDESRLPGLNHSPYQLFWISSAIHHCSKYSARTLEKYIANYQWSPQQYRVNGPLQNIQDFALDFGCPEGSAMNPAVKCEFW